MVNKSIVDALICEEANKMQVPNESKLAGKDTKYILFRSTLNGL